MEILGTTIDNLTREEILEHVKNFLDEPLFHQIATVNPEFLLEAEKNSEFHSVLQNCDLRVADGFGITITFFFKGEKLKYRFPGADLMKEILFIANERGLNIYLALRKDGLSSFAEVKNVLSKKYPNIFINGADIEALSHQLSLITHPASIVLCNFGAPQQELFLNNLKNQNNIRLALGVGGSFDYLTGKQKRAPKWLQSIGLEWFWRLSFQPKRFARIWNAVIIFPFHVFFATIKKH